MSTVTTGLLTSLNVLANRFPGGVDDPGNMRARRLADMGISDTRSGHADTTSWRELVVDSIRSIADHGSPEHRAFRRAVRELQAYSDAELADLGIHRHSIREAVLHGRPGGDVPANQVA